MAIRNFATRMSCFSLISSIETDLRAVIQEIAPGGLEAAMPPDVLARAKERLSDFRKDSFSAGSCDEDLLDFVDFYDLSKILNKLKTSQILFPESDVVYITTQLERLTKCRNRVCHSRPLEPNDFAELLDFTYELIKKGDRAKWHTLQTAIKNLDNPSYALSLKIPEFWKAQKRAVFNNIPLPEFDDTGFMGRSKDRDNLNKLLLSNTKVVSVVGEGGIGKTALAQRCLYDMLEMCEESAQEEAPFDIVVWVSLKTNKLTNNGIEQIRNAITTSSGLFADLSVTLGGSASGLEAALNDITEYMKEFKTLLCIDNLETISGSEIRDFLANVPNGSKIIITTRIGLGEIEYRYKLEKLDDKASVDLMRNMARLINLDDLAKRKVDHLKQICSRLFNNPLLIKWYVLGCASGSHSADLVNRAGETFQDALKFCFENLYDKLDSREAEVIAVIACNRKPISAVELRFLLDDLPEIQVEEALHQLHNSSMLVSVGDKSEQNGRLYALTDIAEEYINSVRPVSDALYQKVRLKKGELKSLIESDTVIKNHYAFDLNAISWKTHDQKICAIFLKKALSENSRGNSALAEAHIERAKALMPDFAECYRIHGAILKNISPFKAETEFQRATEYDPDSGIARYAYAQFLIGQDDFDGADVQINEAIRVDGRDVALITCKAWVLTLKGEYIAAADLYDEILPKQGGRLRKFRVSTYDQAASCFRRMADQFFRDRDTMLARGYLEKGFSVLRSALSGDSFDYGTMKRFIELLGVSEVYSRKTGDATLVQNGFELIENYLSRLDPISMGTLKPGLLRYATTASPDHAALASNVIARVEAASREDAGRLHGVVDIVIEGDKGVSYGFINGSDGKRYFFHRSALRPQTLLDSGNRVTLSFVASENDKGICATDVFERS